jgi:hypothetical protein
MTTDQHRLRHKQPARDSETKHRAAPAAPQLAALVPLSLSPAHVLELQRLAGNRAVNRVLPTIQRLKGAVGTAQAGKLLTTVAFSDDFKEKHTAENAAGAKAATERRIATKKPPAIADGTIPNHVAKLADWKTVIDADAAVVPPSGDWSEDYGDIEDPTWVERLAQVTVAGWEPRLVGKAVPEPTSSTFKRYVGGKWQVTGSVFNDNGDLVTRGSAKMLIDHVTQ